MPRTDRASLLVHAPVERVYAALVEEAALAEWLPPAGLVGRFEQFDPRPGGSYRLVLTYLDPSAASGKTTTDSDVVDVRFVDLVEGERVVQAVDFVADDAALAGTMTMTWSTTPADGGTLVEIVATSVPDGIAATDHAEGLTSSLVNLARHLAR